MTRFSIVTPVFNSERHLQECLDSALGQTFDDIEVICINDGSTDSSRAIVEGRARDDSRVKLVNQENSGPSKARNTGIKAATGDYIIFLDSDDALEPHACARIAQTLDDDVDAIVFGWSCFGGQPNRWMENLCEVPDAFYQPFDPELLFEQNTQPFLRVALRRSSLVEQGIAFDESLRISEDAAFLFSVYPRMAGVRLLSDKLYRYRLLHDGSLMEEVSGNDIAEALHYLNASISIFGDWARGGFLERYGSQLVAWSVKNVLYTMLRQEPPVRDELASALGDLWRAHWTSEELLAMDVPAHVKRLMRHALDVETPQLSRDLLDYRIREYGFGDLIRTGLEKAALRGKMPGIVSHRMQ